MAELKPCPFCGKKDVRLGGIDNKVRFAIWVECKNCECQGPVYFTQEQAIDAWNRREK